MSEPEHAGVECPICGEEFDPTAAGGWCTNPDCGEWQYLGEEVPDPAESEPATEVDDASEASASDEVRSEDSSAEPDDEEPEADDAEPEPAATAAGDEESADEGIEDDAAGEDTDATAEAADDEAGADDEDAGADDAVGDDAVGEKAVDDASEGEVDAEAAEATCPDCGASVDPGDNFCADCGADLRDGETLESCPGCGADVDDEDRFCANCGEDLDAARAALGGGEEAVGDDAVGDAAVEGDAEAPESLVLRARGEDIEIADDQTVGREVRRIVTESGGDEDDAVRIHREHVRFVREGGQFYLVDLGDNPTKLNDRRLSKGDREPVEPGDELELSGVVTLSIEAA